VKVTILNESELRSCVSMDEDSMDAVAEGFSRLTEGRATVPPILCIDVAENNGEVDIKTAYVHGLDSFVIKIASGFFNNRDLGLSTGSGMMVVVSAKTGFPQTVLLDNGYLTDVRTGLAGAIAAQYLSRENI
jgi:ornithine cyclodeaminase/alanine dehydrogenase-like protein (mu-crystallin family)